MEPLDVVMNEDERSATSVLLLCNALTRHHTAIPAIPDPMGSPHACLACRYALAMATIVVYPPERTKAYILSVTVHNTHTRTLA